MTTYQTPARVLACMTPTFNQEQLGTASCWAEVEAILAAAPAGYRFSCLQPVTSNSPNDSFRTDLAYRGYVNDATDVEAWSARRA